ncbi:MAG: M1 family metallopeptidase [Polyangiaceae bacterium]
MKTRTTLVPFAPLAALLFAACGGSPQPPPAPPPPPQPEPTASAAPAAPSDEAVPKVRLPSDTRPTGEALEIHIDPAKDRFSGVVDISIALDQARSVVWLHGKKFNVTRATATPDGGAELAGTWLQRDETGMASLTFPQPLPAGKAKLHIEYDAPFGPKLEGLYKIVQAGTPYAFTQFESIAARDAFPCFDEPGFKIPFDTTLVVPAGSEAIANTHEVDRKTEGGSLRVHFAPTLPLPSYLIAFAVGPLDVVPAADVPPNAVRKRPLPLRAITAKGHGKEIGYALAHTGEILAALENITGIEYPYDKLDILAVPDKGGAMENAGAVTFADGLLLFDEKTAPLYLRRAYASVMAHELAHQWVGDLVTAAWWDDIWLNEAFATWMGTKAADAWDPKLDIKMELLDGVQGAIGADALVSARSIRQPIESTNDIENAFDSITYEKGGGVLSMFERWVGPDVFKRGLHDYLAKHSFGNATADDFLAAESAASGKDVKTPFHTFLDQPGVPFLEAEVKCDGAPRLHLKQSRYLPTGSTGDANKTWQIPVCARYQVGKDAKEACALLTDREGDLALGDKCPDWVFPNADAAGYFRFALAPADLLKLRKKGFSSLTTRDRVAYGNSLRAAYNRAALPAKDVIEAAALLVSDPHRSVADEPMTFLREARDWLYDGPLRASVESYSKDLYHPELQKLGWQAGKGEDPDRVQLRSAVLSFLAFTARDPAVRAEAKKRGLAFLGYKKDGAIHPEAVDPNVAGIALGVVGEEADRALWDTVRAQLAKTDDPELRGKLLTVLVTPKNPDLAAPIRELAFDPSLRSTEVTSPIWAKLGEPETREATWQWVKENFDKLLATVPKHHGQTQLIDMATVFCDEAHAKDLESFFTPARIAQIDGGPRVLAGALEDIRLCTAKRKIQEPSVREMFGKGGKTGGKK